MLHRTLFIILLTCGFLLGCSKKQESSETADTSQNVSDRISTEWGAFKTSVQVSIDTNEARIKRLRDRTGKGIRKTIDSLEAANEVLKQRFAEFRADTDTAWERFKVEFTHDMDQLGTAIADLFRDNIP